MKTTFKKQRGILIVLMSLFLMTACQNENETATEIIEEAVIDDVLAKRSAEIDLMSDDIGFIVEEASLENKSSSSFLPPCVVITIEISTGFVQKTLDFGDGCELPNGNIVSGMIIMSYEVNATMASREIMVSFDNFTRNDVLIEGTRSVERLLSNDAGNPQSTAEVNMQVTWPDGTTATREGTRVREWTEGFASGTWTDNVFLITGNATTTGILGNTHSATITTALRREAACAFIVSGVVELSRNDNTGILAYGEGTCDGEVTWTNPNGDTITIYLD